MSCILNLVSSKCKRNIPYKSRLSAGNLLPISRLSSAGILRANSFDMGERDRRNSDAQTAINGDPNSTGRPTRPGVEAMVGSSARPFDPGSEQSAVRDPSTVFADRYQVLQTAGGDLRV